MPQPPRVYNTPAIVLRQRRIGDADKVLTLYTANGGKTDAVAKGVRKTRSRLAGHVEPLTQAMFMLARGRSMDVVTQVETVESFQGVRDDLERLGRGLYAAELLDRFTEPHEANFTLYRLLLDTLRRLAVRDDIDLPVRFFEMTLLDHLGYRPELEECVVCRRRLEPVTNYWSPAGGGVVCPECRTGELALRALSPNAIKLLRLLLHGRFDDVARVAIAPALADEMERAMREYVRWVLEREVRAASFIDDLRRRRAGMSPAVARPAAD
ncbi:MAG TPA: DNA repair protein RecO [Dehalococcoidia bacterium]|nr:DNA repair protein RecO [Dehalococcoidia bacterium]